MRTQSSSTALLVQLTSTELTELATQVAETIATNVQVQTKKTFTAANLWNIQKQRRSFVTRRFF